MACAHMRVLVYTCDLICASVPAIVCMYVCVCVQSPSTLFEGDDYESICEQVCLHVCV